MSMTSASGPLAGLLPRPGIAAEVRILPRQVCILLVGQLLGRAVEVPRVVWRVGTRDIDDGPVQGIAGICGYEVDGVVVSHGDPAVPSAVEWTPSGRFRLQQPHRELARTPVECIASLRVRLAFDRGLVADSAVADTLGIGLEEDIPGGFPVRP